MAEVTQDTGRVIAMPGALLHGPRLDLDHSDPHGVPAFFLPPGEAKRRSVEEELPRAAPVSGKPWFRLLSAREAEATAGEWRELASRSADDNAFFHPDFAIPASRHLRTDLRFATVRAGDGRLIALAPVTDGRLGHLQPARRTWFHPYAPLGVPLVDPRNVEAGVAGLVEGLAASGRSVILADIPLDGAVAAAVRDHAHRTRRPVTVVNAHARAMLDRPSQGKVDIRETLQTRRRKEFARQMRRLADLGPVEAESATEAGQVKLRFEEFLVLEAAGWKGANGTALASNAETAAFAREAVARFAASGAVRIDSVRLNDKPVASVVCFVAGHTGYTWKIAYDEDFARFSPGAQLMLEVPGSLFGDGGGKVARIDSCAIPDHPMIDHLWQDRLAVGTLVVGPPEDSLGHRLGLALFHAEIRARAVARRVKARLKRRPQRKEDTE